MAKVAALLPAAGRGERLGRGPKAFLPFGDTTLLEFTLQAFDGLVNERLVAVSRDRLAATTEQLSHKATVVEGGRTRQETVRKLLEAASADVVLIHDAARPFLAPALVGRVLEGVQREGAASLVQPVADTLIDLNGDSVDRTGLRAVQTPQGFRRDLLLEAHERARAEGVEATDDAALVRRLGHRVALVAGSAWLFKITTPTDYELAQALLGAWRAI